MMRRPEQVPHLDAVYELLAEANTEGADNARKADNHYAAAVLDRWARKSALLAKAERSGDVRHG